MGHLSEVIVMRPFVPASDIEVSLSFYADLGFTTTRFDEGLAELRMGAFSFLLQAFAAEGFADNYMMQLVFADLESWWKHIESLDLARRYGVRPPQAPALQPWGMRVAYVVDPAGVLWHMVQQAV